MGSLPHLSWLAPASQLDDGIGVDAGKQAKIKADEERHLSHARISVSVAYCLGGRASSVPMILTSSSKGSLTVTTDSFG